MNKDENRLQIESNCGLFVLSGNLGNKYVKCLTPVLYKSKWFAKWKAWQYGCVVVEVTISEFKNEPLGNCYIWFIDEVSGTIFKLYEMDIDDNTSDSLMLFNF